MPFPSLRRQFLHRSAIATRSSRRSSFERTNAAGMASDIVEKGIVLAGGGALLRNLDVLLRDVTVD